MWSVKIHPLVFKEDFPKIDKSAQQRILKSISKKPTVAPTEYGKPLTGTLKGYWRLQVDDYRVIYRVEKERILVYIIKVGIRRDDTVYRELSVRLKG